MTKLEFLERARNKHGYKYKYPSLKDKVLSKDIIDIEYNGVIYKQKVVKHILLGRCPEKSKPTKNTEQFIKEAREVWGDKYDYSLTKYKGALKKVKIIYDGITFEQIASSHLKGKCCEKILTKENFIRKSINKHGNKYDYSLVNFISGDVPVLIGYQGVFFSQKPYEHLNSSISKNKIFSCITKEEFIDKSDLIHDFKYNYDKLDYIKANISVIITCPIHGDFNKTPISHLQGYGCPDCTESKAKNNISKFLEKNNIIYYKQHRFQGCKSLYPLPFDFYIPSTRTCIEFNGIQHFQPVIHFGGVESFERIKINDKIKEDYCEDNYINLIRIRYDQIDDIYKILYDNLKLFLKK